MAYEQARAALVQLFMNVTPPVSPGGYNRAKFHHEPNASRTKLPSSRGFFLRSGDRAFRGPTSCGRRVVNMEAVFAYMEDEDDQDRDLVMMADFEALGLDLQDPAKLAAAETQLGIESTIQGLGNVGAEAERFHTEATREVVDGGELLVVLFPCYYRVT